MKGDTFKNTRDKSKQYSKKKSSSKSPEDRKKKHKNKKTENRKQKLKMADLSPNISTITLSKKS